LRGLSAEHADGGTIQPVSGKFSTLLDFPSFPIIIILTFRPPWNVVGRCEIAQSALTVSSVACEVGVWRNDGGQHADRLTMCSPRIVCGGFIAW
jgi:hypothetical protein